MADDEGPKGHDPGGEHVVEMPIDGVLDLHTFQPAETLDVLGEYLRVCRERGILEIRVIHGKGKGVQRRAVRKYLAESAVVESYRDAEGSAGGWGATLVDLYPEDGSG